jgi:hypothetical protein
MPCHGNQTGKKLGECYVCSQPEIWKSACEIDEKYIDTNSSLGHTETSPEGRARSAKLLEEITEFDCSLHRISFASSGEYPK